MTADQSLGLQKAVIARLRGDAGLAALLGGAHVHDHVPRAATPPYVALVRFESRDLSSSGAEGAEHRFTLHVWPEAQGRAGAHAIAAAIETALAAPMTLDGAALVNIAATGWQVSRVDKDHYRGSLTFRAVTEAAV
jgi:2-methylaconitate cis-trans-isomerase PrpF